MEPDAVEIRVVACLVEKQRTTPDVYPLSLNALRLACNQATNRDPVVDYDEATVSEALRRLALRSWTRLASGAGSRARKYRHLLGEALDVDPAELSLLAVLMLRGAQTPGELKSRTERLHPFEDLAAIHDALERLVERGYVSRLARRPGQKEDRYEQLLDGEGEEEDAPAPTAVPDMAPVAEAEPDEAAAGDTDAGGSSEAPASPPPSPAQPEDDRLARLEADLLDLRRELAELREQLGG